MTNAIDKLKRLDERLVDPELAIRIFFEGAADAIIVVDAENKIRMVNQQAELLFGFHRSKLVGQPVTILMPEEYRERHDKHFLDYKKAPRIRPMGSNLVLEGQTSEGERFPIEINLAPTMELSGLLVAATIRRRNDRQK